MIKSPLTNNICTEVFVCEDHLVSGEKFTLYLDKESDLLITYPQPKENTIYKYYDSEEYNSHSDKAITLFDRVYEFVKGINLKSKYSIISNIRTDDSKILDIGCGTGDFLKHCKKYGWKVQGVEPGEKANSIAHSRLEQEVSKDVSLKSFNDSSFDVVTMWHVLEHRFNIEETILELKRICKPDGLIIIALPNYKSFDANFYKEHWAAYDVPRHLFHFSRKTIDFIANKLSLNLISTKGMYFDSFYVSMLSEKNKHKKSKIIRAFSVGLWSNLKALLTKETSSLIYVFKNSKNSK